MRYREHCAVFGELRYRLLDHLIRAAVDVGRRLVYQNYSAAPEQGSAYADYLPLSSRGVGFRYY